MEEKDALDEVISQDEPSSVADDLREAMAAHEAEQGEDVSDVVEEVRPVDPADEAPDKAEEKPEPLDPPADWPLEDQELFRAQSPEAQKWLLDKSTSFQSDYTTKAEELAAQRKQYEALDAVLSPRQQQFALQGMTPAQTVEQLLALSDFASQDPNGFIQWIAQERGIDLGQYAAKPEGTEDFIDPALRNMFSPIQEQIGALTQQVSELSNGYQQRQTMESESAAQAEMARVQAFAEEKDESGQLKRPYFEEVRALMGAFIQSEQASDLDKAYDMAVRANPETFAKVQAAEKFAAQRAAEKERQEKAEAAKRAGVQITGDVPAGDAMPNPGASVREQLMAQFSNSAGRIS